MSGATKKVLYTAELLQLQYEFKELDFKTELKTPEFLKIHPAGKVPAIDDNGFILFESGAICKYLCNKNNNQSNQNNSSVYPQDLKQRAIVDQWIDFCSFHIAVGISKVVYNTVFAKRMERAPDENALQQGFDEIARFMPIIDAQLQKHSFIAGDHLTVADLTLLASIDYAVMAEIDLSNYPAVMQWKNKITAEHFWKKWNE